MPKIGFATSKLLLAARTRVIIVRALDLSFPNCYTPFHQRIARVVMKFRYVFPKSSRHSMTDEFRRTTFKRKYIFEES